LNQHVTTEWQRTLIRVSRCTYVTSNRVPTTRGTARPQCTVLEPANRVETTREIVLVERQPVGRTVTITIAQLSVQTHGVIVRQWLEHLATVVELEEREIAARGRCFQNQALGMTASSQHTLVQGRLGP